MLKELILKQKQKKEYLIPKLLEEKEELIDELNEKNKTSTLITWWVLGFLSISVFGVFLLF